MSWATAELLAQAGSVAVQRCCDGGTAGPIGSLSGPTALSLRPEAPEVEGLRPQLVCPGDIVTSCPGAMRGRGVVEREDGKLVATVCGVVERINQLLYVRPLKHRYAGEVGDVVVGRIVEIGSEKWVVDIGTANLGSMHIGAIQLPGNVQRRRTDEDAMRMREFFQENDLVVCEVQKVHETGEVALQARSAKYGKLHNGVLVSLPAVYVRRQAQHLITLPQINVMVILGNNGWVWICAPPKVAGSGRQETLNFSQMDVSYQQVGSSLRERIGRVRNAVLVLAAQGLEITPESIAFAYEQSLQRGLAAWELLDASRRASAGLADAVVEDAVSRT